MYLLTCSRLKLCYLSLVALGQLVDARAQTGGLHPYLFVTGNVGGQQLVLLQNPGDELFVDAVLFLPEPDLVSDSGSLGVTR